MRIGLDDIDREVARAIDAKLVAPQQRFLSEEIHWKGALPFQFDWNLSSGRFGFKRKREPSDDERATFELHKRRGATLAARIATIALAEAGTVASGISLSSNSGAAAMATAIVMLVVGGLGMRWVLAGRPRAQLRRVLEPAEMRAVFPLLKLSRAERIYCDTLLLLSRIEPVTEQTGRLQDTLRHINDLIASSRQLDFRKASLLPLLGANSVAKLEADECALLKRVNDSSDPAAKESLAQALEMCRSNMENARAFERSIERINAQQEAILQTLSSAQSALARMHLAREADSAATEEIAGVVARMNAQTTAVEQAVQEVMSLRSS